MVRSARLLLLAPLLGATLLPRLAGAAEPADVALVLVSDVSRSVDDREFRLEKDGYAAAFRDPRVLDAIHSGMIGAIEVAYVEFAGDRQVQTVLDWTPIRDAATAEAFATHLLAAPRSAAGRTAIGSGIDRAVQMIASGTVQASRRVIDVAGDGTNNAGRPVQAARAEALAAGITINGLAIINDHPANLLTAHTQPPGGLDTYYRSNVAGGANSFVLVVHDFHSFGDAMVRKLLSEIAGLPQANG